MRRSLILVSFLLCAFGCNRGRDVLVIRDVTVIDGTDAAAQAGKTVVVERGRVSTVGDAQTVRYPRSARVIDGSGKYLIPGLWDMHVHLGDTDGALPLFIVNGVTSVRDMGSELEATVAIRDQIETGATVGPRILTSGMMVESSSWVARYVDLMREQGADEAEVEEFLRTRILVGNPREAKEAVDSLIARGADFIKIRHAESPEVFAALAEAAGEAGTHLAGHYVWILSLEESAERGQRSIEHNILPGFDGRAPEEKQKIFEALLRNSTHFVPTLVTNTMETLSLERVRALVEDVDGAIDPRNRFVPRSVREHWIETVALDAGDDERPPPEVIQQMIAGSNHFLSEARQAGVEMLAGTDVPTRGTFFGFSLHDELEMMVSTYGMTPMEALRSATSLPAAFMGLDAELGTIEPGKVADLLLLEADPLEDVTNTRRIDTVVVNGRVFDRAERLQMLREVESSIASQGPGSAAVDGG